MADETLQQCRFNSIITLKSYWNFQRKSAAIIIKEPKIDTIVDEPEKKAVTPSYDHIDKSSDETIEKPLPLVPIPEDNSQSVFSADHMIEYQWPPDKSGEFYLLRDQVYQFLETESLEEEYPGKLTSKSC